jgi:topoisomerase-4 subunit B
MRLRPVAIQNLGEVGKVLDFIMGKNTPERREFIIENLVTDVI